MTPIRDWVFQKSTLVGVLLAAVVLYAGKKELATPPLHNFHAGLLAFLLVLSVALILNDDARIIGFVKSIAEIALPWYKGRNGAPPS